MATCPTCGRTDLKMRKSKFDDEIFPPHKMAKLSSYNPIKHTPPEIGEELTRRNPDAAALWEMDCPMSGQPV